MSLVFSKYCHGARNLYVVVRDTAGISWEKILLPKFGKWAKNGRKTGFFEFIEKFGF